MQKQIRTLSQTNQILAGSGISRNCYRSCFSIESESKCRSRRMMGNQSGTNGYSVIFEDHKRFHIWSDIVVSVKIYTTRDLNIFWCEMLIRTRCQRIHYPIIDIRRICCNQVLEGSFNPSSWIFWAYWIWGTYCVRRQLRHAGPVSRSHYWYWP